jgi:DNA-binding response OmpR family regulator
VAVATTGGTVLVVEDNDAVRATLVEALTTQGYAVIAAADGEQAMAAASTLDAPIGFLVTDMMLPAVSGLDVAREVQQRHPDCHVLFVTGYLDLGLRNALPPGASLLQKPFSLRALVAELDQLRRRAESSR